MTIDPNGEYWVGAAIGAVVGGYLNGVQSSGSFNPGDWGAMDWISAGTGAISGAMMGSGIENNIITQQHLSGGLKTGYAQRAFRSTHGGGSSIAQLARTDIKVDKNNVATDMAVLNDGDPTVYVHKNGKVIATGKEPPRASYFYSWNKSANNYNLVAKGYRFFGDWKPVLSNFQNVGDITAPYTFMEWGTDGSFDFKKYFPNQFGNAWGYMMTSQDVGNAMWGSVINRIYYPFGGITKNRMTMISNLVAGGNEEPFSLGMQWWGYDMSISY